MAELYEWVKIKTKVTVLLVINIFQPVSFETIHKNIGDKISFSQLQELLTELTQECKITEENAHYRLTSIGLVSIIPGKGRTIRDIHRMEYLVEYSKQRGRDL